MQHVPIPDRLQGAHGTRTLAIDPTYRGFAFAVLEGSERLVDWALPQVRARGEGRATVRSFAAKVESLLDLYQPHLVVLESPKATRRQKKARQRIELVAERVEARSVPVMFVTRDDVRATFHASGSTKYEIAVALARLFPELESRLPRKRKLWTAEDERMSIFDAVSFAVTALRQIEWRS
jgi:hypothetical protein